MQEPNGIVPYFYNSYRDKLTGSLLQRIAICEIILYLLIEGIYTSLEQGYRIQLLKVNLEQLVIVLLMRDTHANYKADVFLRTTQEIQQERRKCSADYKRRDKYERLREKQQTELIPNIIESHIYSQRKPIASRRQELYQQDRRDRDYHQFSQKCINFLSKKKIAVCEQTELKRRDFGHMLEDIKQILKEGGRKNREVQRQSEGRHMSNDEFLCQTRKISHSYVSQDKIELLRLTRSNNVTNSLKKESSSKEKTAASIKYILNPFMQANTVKCSSVILNDPLPNRRLIPQPTFYRSTNITNRRIVNIIKPTQQKTMCFQFEGESDGQYMKKFKNLMNFIFKVNYSNNIYIALNVLRVTESPAIHRFKVYVGRGNNSLLVKSILKRRFWWEITNNMDEEGISFYWTQNKVDKIHNYQRQGLKSKPKYSPIPQKRLKIDQQDYVLNKKILSQDKSTLVQRYILNEGFIIPFEETTIIDIISNHLPQNNCIGSKKNLFKSLLNYFKLKGEDAFDFIPKTYHIRSNQEKQFDIFMKENQNETDRVWIVKPGENTNRGTGIKLSALKNLHQLLKKGKHNNGEPFTYIVQSYINKPFLYNGRKFDIRHYILLTSTNGLVKAYWYREGYIRTSSQLFSLDDLSNVYIHLTNDAIQKHSQDYQKYEPANKLSYSQFQRYLDYAYTSKGYNFEKDILAKMKQIAAHIIKANYLTIDNKRNRHNFEIFGLDFMVDRQFKPWLIEVNYNPCLEVNCPILERVIPPMIENSFRLALDPLFPPPSHYPTSKRFYLSDHYLQNLKYQLIFDEDSQTIPIINDYNYEDEVEEEQQYQDDGHQAAELIIVDG